MTAQAEGSLTPPLLGLFPPCIHCQWPSAVTTCCLASWVTSPCCADLSGSASRRPARPLSLPCHLCPPALSREPRVAHRGPAKLSFEVNQLLLVVVALNAGDDHRPMMMLRRSAVSSACSSHHAQLLSSSCTGAVRCRQRQAESTHFVPSALLFV